MLNYFKHHLKGIIKYLKWVIHYFKYLSFSKPEKQQIIICFDGVFFHGGLVDRLKGIISYYQVAVKLGYDFKILFYDPFDLDQFLIPNQVDWVLKPKDVKWHPFKDKFTYTVNKFNFDPYNSLKHNKSRRYFVYANIDYSSSIFKDFNEVALAKQWTFDFNKLFKKSPLLQQRLEEESQSKFTAFHTRFTSLMGDFKDTTSLVLSDREQQDLKQKLLEKMQFLAKDNTAFVFSDSINFIEFVTKNSMIKTIKGKPFHMDNFDTDSSIEGHLKTLVDFFMLANSEQIYFLKSDKMYSSSFSKYASFIGDVPFKSIEL